MTDPAAAARLDQALITRAVIGNDARAFEQLVRRHQGLVRAQLRRLLHGDRARADDLAQEAFLLAWRKLPQFRGGARFSTWLHRIAYTCFLQARRKDGAAAAPQEAQHPAAIAIPPPAAPELRLDVERAMRQLSPGEQAVLLHVVQLGLSQEEAAYVLDMPLGTVKSHVRRGKDRLRTLLADWQESPHKDMDHD